MKSIILYATKTGNTEKMAKSISEALEIDCINISSKTDISRLNLNEYDVFFIGTGVYGGKPHKKIIQFLKQFDFTDKKTIAVFLTWLGRCKSDNNAFKSIKNILHNKNQTVYENYFSCYGKSFLFIRYNHPDIKDYKNAIKWARGVI